MPTAKGYTRPRPIRVAFLVEEHEHWRVNLDAVFADSFSRWGGRFSLIVPCERGVIRPAFESWLHTFDPDIIYSYVDLTDDTIRSLHELLDPSFLVGHLIYGHGDRSEARAYIPNLPIKPLGVLSVLDWLTRGHSFRQPGPVELVDVQFGVTPSQFLQENFGCYGRSLMPWPMAPNVAEYATAHTFVPPEIQANPRIQPRAHGVLANSEDELIERITGGRAIVGLAQLSASLTPRLELGDMTWSHTVNLVVGDAFADRILFWNAIQHMPVYLDGGLVSLKVSAADLENQARFELIVQLINGRINVPLGGNASHNDVVLRSTSVPQDELDRLAAKLRMANGFNAYRGQHLQSVDAVVPDARATGFGRGFVEPGSGIFQPTDWHEFQVTEAFRPPLVPPRHIRDTPALPASLKQGHWAQDLEIERTLDHSWIQNVQHRWRFARRLPMAGAFTRPYQLSGGGIGIPRTTTDCLLSVYGSLDGQMPELRPPPDEGAFRYALCNVSDWWNFLAGRNVQRPSKVVDIEPSDKGRYLTALLSLGGGIHRTREIFLSRFWMGQFEALGASSKVTDDRVEAVLGRLKPKLRNGVIANDDDWSRLARLVVSEARTERHASRFLRYDQLEKDFEAFRGRHPALMADEQPADPEFEAYEKASLAKSVQYLCERRILHQGHDWKCPHCFNNNWVSIDNLKATMTCEVCGQTKPAPVSKPWHFKLNGFVLEGLRDHGLLPTLWCLANCAQQADTSFYFLESHNLFYSVETAESGKADAEMDLLVVSEGMVRLCEAKSRAKGVELGNLIELAKRIRPDVVTFAVMEKSTQALKQRGEELRTALAPFGIDVQVMSLEAQHIDDSAILPMGTSARVRVF